MIFRRGEGGGVEHLDLKKIVNPLQIIEYHWIIIIDSCLVFRKGGLSRLSHQFSVFGWFAIYWMSPFLSFFHFISELPIFWIHIPPPWWYCFLSFLISFWPNCFVSIWQPNVLIRAIDDQINWQPNVLSVGNHFSFWSNGRRKFFLYFSFSLSSLKDEVWRATLGENVKEKKN